MIPLLQGARQQGLAELRRCTQMLIGNRTLMDAFMSSVEEFVCSASFSQAVAAARKGAKGTRQMAAALGRASYVGQDRFVEEGGIPDPGALRVVSISRAPEERLGA
jgi:dihydroxyacetone kinase